MLTVTIFRRTAEERRAEVRRQRIESEQRHREELRDGYRRLKEVLPVTNQKMSKISLLDRGTCIPNSCIELYLVLSAMHCFLPAVTQLKYLETALRQVQERLSASENETQRLRTYV